MCMMYYESKCYQHILEMAAEADATVISLDIDEPASILMYVLVSITCTCMLLNAYSTI